MFSQGGLNGFSVDVCEIKKHHKHQFDCGDTERVKASNSWGLPSSHCCQLPSKGYVRFLIGLLFRYYWALKNNKRVILHSFKYFAQVLWSNEFASHILLRMQDVSLGWTAMSQTKKLFDSKHIIYNMNKNTLHLVEMKVADTFWSLFIGICALYAHLPTPHVHCDKHQALKMGGASDSWKKRKKKSTHT